MSGPKRVSKVNPKTRITPEAIAAYEAEDGMTLHVALGLKPWEMSPLQVHEIPEPSRDSPYPWLRSWWKITRLREELEAAVARD